MLRDGMFIPEQKPVIGRAYVKYTKVIPTLDDVIFQEIFLTKENDTIWKTFQKLLRLS